MNTLLKHFRAGLSEVVLDIIWAAWTRVGVMGQSQPGAAWIVDPEPLLLLTWECARQDPRVFDEVLDWLAVNGRWVNVVRLATLLKEDQVCPPSLAGAVAAFMARRDKSPKWRSFAQRCRPESSRGLVPLFQRGGKPLAPLEEDQDEVFANYGWARSSVFLRGQSQPMPEWLPTSLVLKSRALFGVNIRADVFAWLVAHGEGTASGLAREIGYSQRRVQDTLAEMQLAELFQTRLDGNRKTYSLNSAQGWALLFEATRERAEWFNWRPFGRAVSTIWGKAFTMNETDLTDYVVESELGKALAQSKADFIAAGIPLSARVTPAELLEKLRHLAQGNRGAA